MNERIGCALTPLMRHPITTSYSGSVRLRPHTRCAESFPCGVCARRVRRCSRDFASGREAELEPGVRRTEGREV